MGVAVSLWSPNFGLVSDLNVSGYHISQNLNDGVGAAVVGRESRRSTNRLQGDLVRRRSVAPLPVVNHTPTDLIVRRIDECGAARLESADPCLIPDDGEASDLAMAPAFDRSI